MGLLLLNLRRMLRKMMICKQGEGRRKKKEEEEEEGRKEGRKEGEKEREEEEVNCEWLSIFCCERILCGGRR